MTKYCKTDELRMRLLEQPRRPLTFAENAILTIKILMIAAVIVGALAAFVVWTR